MSVISANNAHKKFGDTHVLRGINFSVEQGRGVILLGANGCGKSTLLRAICALTSIDQGDISINGESLRQASGAKVKQLRSQMGVVFQRFNLVGNISVFQNVLFGAMGNSRWGLLSCMAPFASSTVRDRAMACLERVNLVDKAKQKADELSGGQQQRVAIARMLMQNPRVVLADEPIASLDPKSGREVMELLWEVVRERGLTVICSLHQLDVALQYGDFFLGMKAGKIVIDAPRSEINRESLEELYQGHVRVDQQPPPENNAIVTLEPLPSTS